ncbi:alpha/beta fold hydrolase [Sphingobium sp. AS12]|jgi:dienelactone hydrolase|uniref:alpha/beta hydrolase family protein n=1 Tax=Sphingobium sp. AS12 TaxID=2849495 RepID=UPI001C314F12|nr:alpha/beta fold hydrolase [Sphingobium sp. AS12]MBV2148216.1 alpha/beta fold hydrolase [Sphingobium sp. AS12]
MSDPSEIDENGVALTVEKQKVVGTLLQPEVPVPGVLFIHGWGGDQAEDLGHAEALARLGCVCFTFDLRGHADSDADKEWVTRQDGLNDVLAAYDYLAANPLVDTNAIGVVGTSYGGYLAMLLTAHRPVRWLAMRVPALYPDDDWDMPKAKLNKDVVRAYREQSHDAGADRALSACANFCGDVLIVECEKDEQIPREAIISMQGAFRRANSLTHRIIHGATHAMRDKNHQRTYATLLTGWIDEMVRAVRLTI